ncbi:MAG TPA: VWA domain-containing protein [Desulfopila sp.]|nr:VWA domain-containing protein [Desulfopila sp.]
MHFDQPLWILAAVFSCATLFLVHLHLQKKRKIRLHSFAAASLISSLTGNVSSARRRIKLMLVLSALFFSLLALARPQYGHRWIDVKRKGIDILFAVDTSASMLAPDIRPNRLERSKLAILDFVERLDGDRVGLMPFAGSAFLMCPLTIDYTAFEETLQALDTTIIPEPGTNLEGAIEKAGRILDNDANHKLLVIITDGEDLEGNALAAADRAYHKGMTIFTVGVGTREGELVPLAPRDSDQNTSGYMKDGQGQYIISRLDEDSLHRISKATDGLYAPLGSRGQGLDSIYTRKLSLIPKEELAERRQKVPVERFPWFLGLALFLLMLEYLIAGRKSPPSIFSPLWKRDKALPAVALILAAAAATPSSASPGEEAFNNGEYQSAIRYYEELLASQPEDVIHYNYGTAAYKTKLYDKAITAFSKALHSDNPLLQEKAYFNLGNAHFQMGKESLEGDVDKTVDQWLKALSSYEAALELQPDNSRAKNNYQTVKKKLEDLRKQQQESQQKKTEKDDGQDNSDTSAGQRQQQQRDNGKPQQGQSPEDGRKKDAPERVAGEEGGKNSPVREIGTPPDDRTGTADHAPQHPQEDALNKHQALQLLDEMKNEEGTLNLVPQPRQNIPPKRGKNW